MKRQISGFFICILLTMHIYLHAAHNAQTDPFETVGPDGVAQLMETAKDIGTVSVRSKIKAIQRLGELKAVEAVPILLETLGYGSETSGRELNSYYVRLASAKALWQIGDVRAVKALARTVLSDNDTLVKRAAIQALGILGEKARTKEVLTYLHSVLAKTYDNSLAAEICDALGKIGDKSSYIQLLIVMEGPYSLDVKDLARNSVMMLQWSKPSAFDEKSQTENK